MAWLAFILGVFAGAIVTYVNHRRHMIGNLRVDRSDPDDNPYIFLESSVGLDSIEKMRYVLMDVKVENYISQK